MESHSTELLQDLRTKSKLICLGKNWQVISYHIQQLKLVEIRSELNRKCIAITSSRDIRRSYGLSRDTPVLLFYGWQEVGAESIHALHARYTKWINFSHL